MKTYRTSSGDRVSGDTARDVIKALRATSRDPESSLDQFMQALATRVYRQTGHRIPTASQARFVAGLVGAGLLTEEGVQMSSIITEVLRVQWQPQGQDAARSPKGKAK